MPEEREQFQRVRQIFEAALDRDPERRAAFLETACGEDAVLRSRVEALLAADESTGEVLEHGAADLAARFLSHAAADSVAGERIGAHRLVREIGRGGMGTIYLAERDDGQYREEVAIKLIRGGLDSDAVYRRFLQERQILADLRHPNIARMLDGGVTEQGQPYFVMELIDGVPITRYCEAESLTTVQRVVLVQSVCEAVQAAHRQLVVHCDLKPSNILVTEQGRPKLLDFGIARLLDAGPGELTMTSAVRPFTPGYASPEQIRGQALTTASDVYSLGVVLYELLTGRSPYRLEPESQAGEAVGHSFYEVERAVCEQEPEKPSTAVVTAVAAGRGRKSAPEKLSRSLAGDLDNIVLKALAKQPERRYGSADQLAEDLRRHLEGLPVRACKPTLGYRGAKFLRRHRVGLAATFLVLLSLVGGIVATTLKAREARQRGQTAERALGLLIGLFEGSDPDAAGYGSLTLQGVLNEGAEKVFGELEDEPLVQATLMDAIGDIYRKLGNYDEAERLLEPAHTIRRRHLGPEHPDLAVSWSHLGFLKFARASYDEAAALFRRALELRLELHDGSQPEVAESLHRLALVLREQGHFDEAEKLYGRALAMRRELYGDEHPDIALTLNHLGTLYLRKGDAERAETYHLEALELQRKLFGERHWHVASTVNSLGQVRRRAGDLAGAETFYRKALEIQRQLFGRHPDVAKTLNNLGIVLYLRRDDDGAEACYREALGLQLELLGEHHPHVATMRGNLALVVLRRGELEAAEEGFRQALAIHRRVFGERHPQIAADLRSLAQVPRARGDARQVEALLRQALDIQLESLGGEHLGVASTQVIITDLLLERGAFEEAEAMARSSLRIRLGHGASSFSCAVARGQLGAGLAGLGRLAEAEDLLLAAHAVFLEERGVGHARTLSARRRLHELYQAWGRAEEARLWRH